MYCMDRLERPDNEFVDAQRRANPDFGGSLHYRQLDVRDEKDVDETMGEIATQRNRLDGLIAAAGINSPKSALEHSPTDMQDVMSINFNGVFISAKAAAREIMKRQQRGSILLVASMSGIVANKGMDSAAYNSSKAAVMQLTRCLAMEWGMLDPQGRGSIRVNCLCPGHISTPMVTKTVQGSTDSMETWKHESMLGRIAKPEEFRGAGLFLLSDASSYITGSALIADGGHSSW